MRAHVKDKNNEHKSLFHLLRTRFGVTMIGELFGTVSTLLEGGERYAGATKVAWDIERYYRHYRQQQAGLEPLDQSRLLAQTHYRGAVKLAKLFHDNGAIWVKFGQFLSSRSDILPLPYVSELEKLQNDAKPVPFRQLEPVLREEWGKDWRDRFAHFEETPVAAASVAQVHRAILSNGAKVAVKVQLPHARRLFKQDSAVFRAMAKIGAPLISHFDLKQVIDQIVDMTLNELDFLQEEANLKKFEVLPHHPLIRVPHLFEEMSSARVLVSEWIDGVKLSEYLARNPQRAQPLLREMLSCYVQQITAFGVYHADPHPGNFLVMDNGQVAVLDYGALGVLTAEETRHYAVLLQVLFGKIQVDEPLGELFRKAGFVARDQKVFEEVAELVLKEALRKPGSTEILALAMNKMRDLKIRIPDSFVSVARVVLTFGGLLKMYQVSV